MGLHESKLETYAVYLSFTGHYRCGSCDTGAMGMKLHICKNGRRFRFYHIGACAERHHERRQYHGQTYHHQHCNDSTECEEGYVVVVQTASDPRVGTIIRR